MDRDKGYNILKGGSCIQFHSTCMSMLIPIILYDLDGNITKEFSSVFDCKYELNLSNYMFYNRINGKYNIDYILKYKEGCRVIEESQKSYKKIKQYDLNGNLLRVFNSFKEASNDGYSYKKIHRCLTGNLYTYKDSIWKYDNDNENLKLSNEDIEYIKEQQRKIEDHDNLREGSHKVVEQTYNKPAIQYYLKGLLVKEFTYRWEAVLYFRDHNLLNMALLDKRIVLGNISKSLYPRLPYPEIELCYKGNESNLKYNRDDINIILKNPYYDRGLSINEIRILLKRLLNGRNEIDLKGEEYKIWNELKLRENRLNGFIKGTSMDHFYCDDFSNDLIKIIYNLEQKFEKIMKKLKKC